MWELKPQVDILSDVWGLLSLSTSSGNKSNPSCLIIFLFILDGWGGGLSREYVIGGQMSNCRGCGERSVFVLSPIRKEAEQWPPSLLPCERPGRPATLQPWLRPLPANTTPRLHSGPGDGLSSSSWTTHSKHLHLVRTAA